jgi:hypothetical protein
MEYRFIPPQAYQIKSKILDCSIILEAKELQAFAALMKNNDERKMHIVQKECVIRVRGLGNPFPVFYNQILLFANHKYNS